MKNIFYGWYIVAAALLLTTFSSMMFVYGFTAFMDPIATTFAWSIAQVSFASSIRGLEGGTLDPIVGAIADRWSAKKLMIVGTIIVSAGIFFLSRTTSLWMFYGGFLIVGLGSSIGIHIVPATVIARWFKKNIGKANGVLSMGFALGGLYVPMLTRLIDAYGWQNTLMYMSIAMLLLGIPLSFIFRDRPEDYGMLPDGVPQETKKSAVAEIYADEPDISIRDVLKMRIFWFMGIAAMFQVMAMQAVNIHIMTYMGSLGMDRNMASMAVVTLSVCTLVARVPFGFLADIYPKKFVLALSLILTSAGLVIFGLNTGSSFLPVILFAAVYGVGTAGSMPLRGAVVREYFGAKRFGTIYGLMAIFSTIGVSIGAPLAGWVFDTRGTYNPIWFVFAVLSFIGTLMVLTLQKSAGEIRRKKERKNAGVTRS